MVQIANAVLFAAVVAPILAAPLEAREPRFNAASLKRAGHIAGKVASGAGVAATVGSLVIPQGQQQRRNFDDFEEIEAREPRLSSSGLKRAGHIAGKVASGAGVAATIGSLVMPQGQQQQRRSFGDFEEVEAREPRFSASGLKKAGHIAGKVASGAGVAATVGSLIMPQQQRRSLEAREPRISSAQAKSIVKGAAQVGGYAKSGIEFGAAVSPLFPHKSRRSLEDIEARKFRVPSHSSMRAIGGAIVSAAGFGGTIAAMNTKPQRRELEERNFLSTLGKDVGKVAKFVLREDELDAREPNFFGTLAKDVGKVAKLVIREDENGELYVRDYSDEYYLD